MQIKRVIRPFRRLRGKLTLSFTLTSVAAFLCIEILFIAVALVISSLYVPIFTLNDLKQEAPQATPYFVHGRPDREELTTWLTITNANLPHQGPYTQYQALFLCAVDTQGRIIASTGSQSIPPDTALQNQLSTQAAADLHTVLQDTHGTNSRISIGTDNSLLAITPIMDTGGHTLQGALVMKVLQPDKLHLITYFFTAILGGGLIVAIIAALAGMLFGYLNARNLTRRLKALSSAGERWSHGDFSVLTHDTSEDELGQVSRQFNRMAEQLQHLLDARQKLATLEERNRLARDLHDSIKQQIFVVVMQLGATRVLIKQDVQAAATRLQDVEKLVLQIQQELTALIRELRPIALEGKGIAVALRELTTQWAQQTEIVATVRVEDVPQTLPLPVEEALFRVAQEALSNIARHSKANLVQMLLTTNNEKIILTISDNGLGFDASRQLQYPKTGPKGEENQMPSLMPHGEKNSTTMTPHRPGDFVPGVGLLSMQERMKALEGDVQIASTPGEGTSIIASCKRGYTQSGAAQGSLAGLQKVKQP